MNLLLAYTFTMVIFLVETILYMGVDKVSIEILHGSKDYSLEVEGIK